MRILSSFIFFVAVVWVSAAAAQLPCGEPLTFERGQPVEYALHNAADGGEPWAFGGVESVFVHPQGYVTLGDRFPFEPEGHPMALDDLNDNVSIITPFWLPAASCESAEPASPPGAECHRPADTQGRVDAVRDAAGLHITWFGLVPECEPGAPRASFSLSIAPPDEDGHHALTFRYAELEWAGVDGARMARAGVQVGGAGSAYELFVDPAAGDGDDVWGGAGNYPQRLLHGGGEGEPGVWLIVVGPDGRVVGDEDGDGIRGVDRTGPDNCPWMFNPLQLDTDGDQVGDTCDPNDDNDDRPDRADNCPQTSNDDQRDTDGDGRGDACDLDDDGDRVPDVIDNCPRAANANQSDLDGDQHGDACDRDIDGDEPFRARWPDAAWVDLCPWAPDQRFVDSDADGIGDSCDLKPYTPCHPLSCVFQRDADADGVVDALDGCPRVSNADQSDNDGDGVQDACDPDADGSGRLDAVERRCVDDLCLVMRARFSDLGDPLDVELPW